MHKPNVVSDKLIYLASVSVLPVAPVFEMRSEPAKSTRLSLEIFLLPSLRV